MSLPDHAVSIENLTKVYGRKNPKKALDNVSLAVPRGSMMALLGPNGAGKSTMINIMAGLVNKTSGTVKLWDHDIDTALRPARMAIGVVPQEINMDPYFTPLESLEMHAGMYGIPPAERRSAEILEAVGLADKAHAYARTLSGGMRRRLLVAKALVHSPPILVLDEPTAGVDIELRQQLWTYVRALNRQGTTILLTTHYLEEAEELCDTIAIINHGKVVCCEPKEQLLGRLDSKVLTVHLAAPLAALPESFGNLNAELADNGHVLRVTFQPSQAAVGQILEHVQSAGLQVADLSTEETDLADVFLQLTRSRATA